MTIEQMMLLQCCAMLTAIQHQQVQAQQNRPYKPTEASATKTRQALGAMGLSHVPGPRKRRPTAAEQAAEQARKMGFDKGKFVG